MKEKALVLLAVVSLGGCSLLYGTDALRGQVDGGKPDAATGTDAAGDAMPPADAAADGGADSTVSTSCGDDASGSVVLCTGFEDGQLAPPFTAQWQTGDSGLLRIVDGGYDSALAAQMTYPQSDGGAVLFKEPFATTNVVTVRLHIYVAQRGQTSTLDAVWVDTGAGERRSVSLDVSPSGLVSWDVKVPFDSGVSDELVPTGLTLFEGSWRLLRLVIRKQGPSSSTVELFADGVSVSSRTIPIALLGNPLRLKIGDENVQTITKAWIVRYDDVLVLSE
jgi:hypothetical protein